MLFKYQFKLVIYLGVALLGASSSLAQTTADDDFEIVNLELNKSVPKPTEASEVKDTPVQVKPVSEAVEDSAQTSRSDEPLTFDGLGKLAPFKEVSVIQRKFLPKTQRFEFNLAGSLVTNAPFYNTLGVSARLGYAFTELIGVELQGIFLSTSERDITKELRSIQGIATQSLNYAKSYMGGDLKLVPFYGKMSMLDQKIIPFDLFILLGAGTTVTNTGENAPSFHAGAGQTFALGKSTAFRWDFGGNFYRATGFDGKSGNFNNLFLQVGYSWFFPEATYR